MKLAPGNGISARGQPAQQSMKKGVTGFDSRQSLIVSTSRIVWSLVNRNTQTTNGNNSYALAA